MWVPDFETQTVFCSCQYEFLPVLGLLDSCSGDGLLLLAVKEQLWRYELHAVMLTALKQDFNKILDGWNTAVKVARILMYVIYAKYCLYWY